MVDPIKEYNTIMDACRNNEMLSVSGENKPHFEKVSFFGYMYRVIKSKLTRKKDDFADCKDVIVAHKIADFLTSKKDKIIIGLDTKYASESTGVLFSLYEGKLGNALKKIGNKTPEPGFVQIKNDINLLLTKLKFQAGRAKGRDRVNIHLAAVKIQHLLRTF